MAVIAMILILCGIGQIVESILAGIIRVFVPYQTIHSGHHYVRKGAMYTIGGIILMLLYFA